MTLESGGSWQGMPDQEPYYDLPFGRSEPLSGSEEELLDQLDATLRAAVARQTVSDVPLGAFLSGGVDSSLVVGYLAEHASGPVETFSVSFEDDPHDEAPFAEAVARKYDTRHHRIVVGGDRLADLERLAGTFDEPFADPAAVPTAILSDLARQHVTVVLSGDGGDETHAGLSSLLPHAGSSLGSTECPWPSVGAFSVPWPPLRLRTVGGVAWNRL